MKYLLSILFLLFNIGLLSQNIIDLDLDSNYRSVPEFGFNGNTIRGPGWSDLVFNDSVATMYPEILRYPGGGPADYWDWNTGWFLPQSVLDTAITDTIYTMNSGWYNLDTLDNRPIIFQQALDQIGAEGLYIMNMMSANISVQSQYLRNVINDGVYINKVELGSETNHDNIFKIMKYPTAGDYARACNIYIDSIRAIVPNVEIAVVGGNRGADSSRSWSWNDSIYNIVDSADALVWHPYIYLTDEDTLYTKEQILAYPFYRLPLIEKWRDFNDTISELQDYEIWVTEYNLFDKTYDLRYTNTWAHVLIMAGMHNMLMYNDLVEMLLLHNVGGIFNNFDALNTQNNFRKRSTGFFAHILYNIMKDMDHAYPIITPESLIDTINYQNSNGLVNEVFYPKLFGWKFKNNNKESAAVINISNDTLFVSISSFFSGEVSWCKWSSDSLFASIDSITYIYTDIDSGTVNVKILPYSINVVFSNDNISYSSGSSHEIIESKKELIRIVDVLGRRSEHKNNVILFFIYDDGTVEKKFFLD